MNKMNITDYLNQNKMPWAYISLNLLPNGKLSIKYLNTGESFKYPNFYNNTKWKGNQTITEEMRKSSVKCYRLMDKFKNEGNNEKYKQYKSSAVYVAYGIPENQVIIDVDDSDAFETQYSDAIEKSLHDTVQYKSRGKRLSHYIVNMTTPDKDRFSLYDRNIFC